MAGNSGKTATGRPFQKGQSGNPKGRPKVAEEFRAECRDFSPTAFAKLKAEVAKKGENWFRAAELILAYAHGKPTQPVAVSPFDEWTDERLEARFAELISQGASATKPPESGE